MIKFQTGRLRRGRRVLVLEMRPRRLLFEGVRRRQPRRGGALKAGGVRPPAANGGTAVLRRRQSQARDEDAALAQ